MTAELIVIWPSLVCVRPRSISIRMMTGRDEMDMAAPTNTAKSPVSERRRHPDPGQEQDGQGAERERHGDSQEADGEGGACVSAHCGEIDLHPGYEQEVEHAEVEDGVHHQMALLAGLEQLVVEAGRHPAQNRRADEDSAYDLAQDGGLAEPPGRGSAQDRSH